MLTDLDLVKLQLAAYEYDGMPFAWDWSAQIKSDNIVLGGIKNVGDDQVLIFPGTRTLDEWRMNFQALPESTDHPVFGPVHRGFFTGLEPFVTMAQTHLNPNKTIYVVGHSRGAAEAPLAAALLRMAGLLVTRIVMFAPPKTGEAKFVAFMAPVDKVLYRNSGPDGHDYVTDVPAYIPGLAPYVHLAGLTDVRGEPDPLDAWGLFRFHHIQYYLQGLSSLYALKGVQ